MIIIFWVYNVRPSFSSTINNKKRDISNKHDIYKLVIMEIGGDLRKSQEKNQQKSENLIELYLVPSVAPILKFWLILAKNSWKMEFQLSPKFVMSHEN